jgi:hypothetical protein
LHENRVGRVAPKLEKPTCEYEAVVANSENCKLLYSVLELERIRFGTAAGNGVWIRTIPAWTVAGIGVWIRTIRAWTLAGIGVWIGTIWAKIIIIRTVRLIVYLRTATVVRIPCAAIWTHIHWAKYIWLAATIAKRVGVIAGWAIVTLPWTRIWTAVGIWVWIKTVPTNILRWTAAG